MGTSDDVMIARSEDDHPEGVRTASRTRGAPWSLRGALTGGGTDGNEHLTTVTGAILIVLLAVIGFTIPQLRQFIWLHLFVGMLLFGPVLLKMASAGYRFISYYAGSAAYRVKGPPELILRLIAPVVVISTVAVFATGVALLIVGPQHRDPWLLLHKVSFIVWVVFMSLHVLGHLPAIARAMGIGTRREAEPAHIPGAAGRWIALSGALVAGAVLAVVLIPEFSAWTAHGVFVHHHHRG